MPIQADDLEAFATAMASASRALPATFEDIDHEAALLIVAAGVPRTPRRTGALASGHVVVAGTITNQRRYALPVHAGWSRGTITVAGRPWLYQGESASHDDTTALYAKGLDKTLGKVATP